MLERDSVVIIMKAIILEKTCNADELTVKEVNKPKQTKSNVLIEINGFGINRSEIILRKYEANEPYIKLPIIPGIECVGTVIEDNEKFNKGDVVIGLMGGMGRSFNGSYAEYASIPNKNVFKINEEMIKKLKLEEIIAIPETFLTAYGSLFECLKLNKKDTLLIRGGTSATGISALKLAKKLGCTVISTTRNNTRVEKLEKMGADLVIIDNGDISEKILSKYPEGITKILELVGPSTMNNSMKILASNGILCITGILGKQEYLENFDPIKDIPNGKYLTSFFSNYPTQEVLDSIFKYIIDNEITPEISKVFTSLEEVKEAHKLMESNNAEGKIVIKLKELVKYD
ncbi:MAG: hypothetical protein E7Z84_02485 [Methanosphaera stadtmanae]|nr:hypothetical protein [Methanosphaera stadtmanae]